jgi:probable phosphoglycerate mutase
MAHPELWIARHGETDWSASGRHTGRSDIPLNDNGRAAAKALGNILAGREFELVLTSPLARASDTCTLAGFGDRAETDPDLVEWDYGEYEGVTTPEIRETRPGWTVFEGGCPGGETIEEVAARVDRVIARARNVEGPVLAFGHGHCLRVLGARWIEQAPETGGRLALETATVCVLGWDRETAVIDKWNTT